MLLVYCDLMVVNHSLLYHLIIKGHVILLLSLLRLAILNHLLFYRIFYTQKLMIRLPNKLTTRKDVSDILLKNLLICGCI